MVFYLSMLKKNIRYLYTNDMYEFTLEIIFTNDVKKSLASLYKKWGIKEEVFNCEGCTVTDEDDNSRYGLIFDYNKLTTNLIAHECLHLSAFLLDDRNIDLAGSNSDYENLAWINGLLNDLVHQIIEKEGIEIYQTKILSKFKKL